MEMVYVKPAEGARVRMPDRNSNVMPPEGQPVPRNVHYERLIITGELVVDEGKTKELHDEMAKHKAAATAPAEQQAASQSTVKAEGSEVGTRHEAGGGQQLPGSAPAPRKK